MTREEAREFLLSIANQLGCIGVEDLTDRDGKRMIEAIKALEEPPERTGKWVDGYRWQRCSLCSQTGRLSWKYCPNCGAKMGGEEDV